MRLSDFIRRNRPAIIQEWQDFARTVRPSLGLTDLQLNDHIDDILSFIADDIETAQSDDEQFEKSQGRQEDRSPGVDTAAQTHAAMRHREGFDIVEMVPEYRALRASVTKLWAQARNTLTDRDTLDLGRFNEAIDQALAESVARFTQNVDQAKDLLLGMLGHDIRTPVATIRMAADLVPQAGAVNLRQRELLDQIRSSSERVELIVRDLLDMTKFKAGQTLPLSKRTCSLSGICRRIIGETRVRHPDRDIRSDLPDAVEGLWDETRLGQLLANLLANAIQYGAADAPIVVTVADEGRDAVLSVTNGGNPIPAVHLDTIFQAFSRVSSGDAAPTANLGLGLFISREIAVAHGGSISVVSGHGDGTTFFVRLPKRDALKTSKTIRDPAHVNP